MNLSDLRTAVEDRGYDFEDALLTRTINAVYRQIAGLRRWPWLERLDTSLTTTAADATVPLTAISDLMWVDAVRLQESTTTIDLTALPVAELRQLEHQYPDAAGTPRYWTEAFGELRFYPTPDRTLTVVLDYITTPPELSADIDIPLFDSMFHDVLADGAAEMLAKRQRDSAAAAEFRGAKQVTLEQMMARYGIRQRQQSDQVRSGYWGGSRAR